MGVRWMKLFLILMALTRFIHEGAESGGWSCDFEAKMLVAA